jgi:hypothetical protein
MIKAALLIFLGTFAVVFLFSPYFVNLYDEGLILAGALRIMAGETPGTDFYTNYGPAQFYLVAMVCKIFGATITTTRVYDALISAAIVPAAYWLLSGQVARSYLIAALISLLVFLVLNRSPLYPITPEILLILLGCHFTTNALARRESALVFLPVALIISAMTAFRYDFGQLGILIFGTPVFLVFALQVRARAINLRGAITQLISVGALVGMIAGITLGGIYLLGILKPALYDILTYNTSNYAEMRSLPFPRFLRPNWNFSEWFSVYLPPGATLIGVITCFVVNREGPRFSEPNRLSAAERRLVLLMMLISATLFCYGKNLVRTSGIHALVSDIPAILLVFLCLEILGEQALATRVAWVPTAMRIIVVGSTVLFVAVGLNEISKRGSLVRFLTTAGSAPKLPALGIFGIEDNIGAAARYVINTTRPDDRILSATGRHDKIYINDNAFYFLTERLPGTRWHQYDPGVQTTDDVQREIIQELEVNDVAIIVRNLSWDDKEENNKSAVSSGITILDDYIDRTYREERRFGRISVHRRIEP